MRTEHLTPSESFLIPQVFTDCSSRRAEGFVFFQATLRPDILQCF